MTRSHEPSSADTTVCGACIVKPPPWRRTVAPFVYAPPLSVLIDGLKSGNGRLQARILGALLAPRLQSAYRSVPMPDAIVPVPLTRRRLRQRGFNQAALLAARISAALGVPRVDLLTRRRDTPPQRTLPRSGRLRNVRGAFGVAERRRRWPLSQQPPMRSVALLDDVTTTGATARAATEALRSSGIEEVHVWVAAKTRTQQASGT